MIAGARFPACGPPQISFVTTRAPSSCELYQARRAGGCQPDFLTNSSRIVGFISFEKSRVFTWGCCLSTSFHLRNFREAEFCKVTRVQMGVWSADLLFPHDFEGKHGFEKQKMFKWPTLKHTSYIYGESKDSFPAGGYEGLAVIRGSDAGLATPGGSFPRFRQNNTTSRRTDNPVGVCPLPPVG